MLIMDFLVIIDQTNLLRDRFHTLDIKNDLKNTLTVPLIFSLKNI